ncbi:hypothetical protein [Variovorax sp. SRS16]|uniref:hypothetical protein n=1 Tax=Variovorax sp. SRS16 TaxID=282217 RepID=UPI0013A5491E|nr:hypothetical protein [Variovorax sp. SRS16]
MSDSTIATAIVGAVAGVVGGLVSPVFNLIQKVREERNAETERKRAQIASWRRMILEVDKQAVGSSDVSALLQTHADYLSLEPHLDERFRNAAYIEPRVWVVGEHLSRACQTLKKEIDRIEGEWGLRK